jgi:hypothetical protein
MSRDETRLVLHRHRPGRTRLIIGVAATLLVTAGYGLYQFGRSGSGAGAFNSNSDQADLIRENRRLAGDNRALKQKVARLETDLTVDRQAYDQIEAQLVDLQARIMEQEEDLAFYKSIVAPEDGAVGLRVQKLVVQNGADPTSFRVRWVLIQAKEHDRRVSGVVDFSVEGTQDGKTVTYGLADLDAGLKGNGELPFSFRYFQDFEHELTLPKGFVPARIHLEVRPTGRSARTLRDTFEWLPG